MADTKPSPGAWVYTMDASVQALPEDTAAGKGCELAGAMISFEAGKLDDAGIVELFQRLVDTGLAWQLHEYYGWVANELIEDGYVKPLRRIIIRCLR